MSADQKQISDQTREEPDNEIYVTRSWCQLGNAEDVYPGFLCEDQRYAMVVCDGHNGNECASFVSASMTEILKMTLHSGARETMQWCLERCETFRSGAVICIALYDHLNRVLNVVSVGDINCVAYQGNQIIFQQPHHTWADIHNDVVLHDEFLALEQKGEITKCNGTGHNFIPSADGTTMCIGPIPVRFKPNGDKGTPSIASFLGHASVPRMNPIFRNFTIPPGEFRIVMSSDGLSDVVSPKDDVMSTCSAHELVHEATRRWTTPVWTQSWTQSNNTTPQRFAYLPQFKRYIYNSEVICPLSNGVTKFPIGRNITVPPGTEEHPHAPGSDDISVLVLTGVQHVL